MLIKIRKLKEGRPDKQKRLLAKQHSISFKSAYLSLPVAKQELAPYTSTKAPYRLLRHHRAFPSVFLDKYFKNDYETNVEINSINPIDIIYFMRLRL